MYFQCHCHIGPDQTGEVRDDFLCNLACIPTYGALYGGRWDHSTASPKA